ncbi:MAG: hypothetical protein H7Y88_10240 [Phycisphaerales bacterium]|nr:hypothetical protein [Phycisphaerales bacterium]
MHCTGRVLVYGGWVVAAVLTVSQWSATTGSAVAAAGTSEPPAARLATCDIYQIADKLMSSERFKPEIEAEMKKLQAEIEPLIAEVKAVEEKGRGMDPKDPALEAVAQDYQKKIQDLQRKRQELDIRNEQFVAGKYVEAYEQARSAADGVADDLGYTHVIASRKRDAKIEAASVQSVKEAVLARPCIKSPEDADITEDVVKDLKLE